MRSCLFCYITALVITLFFLSPNFEIQLGIDSKMRIYISQSHCPFLFLNMRRSPKPLGSSPRSLCASWMPPRALLPPASAFAHLQLLRGLLLDWTSAQLEGGKHTGSLEYNSDNIGAGWLIPQLSMFKVERTFQTILKAGPYFTFLSIKTGVLCSQVYDDGIDRHLSGHI